MIIHFFFSAQLVTKKRLPTATSNQSPQANALQHNTGLRRWQEEKGKSTTRHSTNRCHSQADALRTHPRQPGNSPSVQHECVKQKRSKRHLDTTIDIARISKFKNPRHRHKSFGFINLQLFASLRKTPDPIEKGKTTDPGQSFKEGLLT